MDKNYMTCILILIFGTDQDRSFSFSFHGHCVVCSSIYGFLPPWYLQTLFTSFLGLFRFSFRV